MWARQPFPRHRTYPIPNVRVTATGGGFHSCVMAALVAAIHVFARGTKDVDGRRTRVKTRHRCMQNESAPAVTTISTEPDSRGARPAMTIRTEQNVHWQFDRPHQDSRTPIRVQGLRQAESHGKRSRQN